MIDALLKQAAESEPGFSRKAVKWAITCSADGRYTGVIPLSEERGRFFPKCPHLMQSELVGGKEGRSQYLMESLSTIALLVKEDASPTERRKTLDKHRFFVRLLNESSLAMPQLRVAARVLEGHTEQIRQDLLKAKAKPTDSATVLIDDLNPLESTLWHEWWRTFRRSLKGSKSGTSRMRCVVSGDWVEPALTHPKIKGLAGVGGLATGDVLVGFDKDSSRSYGLDQSANAAMSEETATAYIET